MLMRVCFCAVLSITPSLLGCGDSGDSETNASVDAGVDGANTTPTGSDAGVDGGEDAASSDTGVGEIDAGPPQPTLCAPEDIPSIATAVAMPNTFTVAEVADASSTVTFAIEIYCFERPIDSVTIAVDNPRTVAAAEDFTIRGDLLTVADLPLNAWLSAFEPGTYPVNITVSGTDETLTEAGIVTLTIEE